MKSRAESILCFSRTAIIATAILGSGACAPSLRAQASEPGTLRQIIERINRDAAAATWGNQPSQPLYPSAPSSPQPSSPSNSGGYGSSSSDSPTSGGSGFATAAPGSGAVSSSDSASKSSALNIYSPSINRNNSAAPTQQPGQGAATPPSPESDVLADSVPPPSPTTEARAANVTYVAGLLTVHADDSSLNQILRQVAQLTGMKITGGVADERVFGDYGPSKASTIVSKLLEGTRSNMVLREGPHATITQLILVPRNGGAMPPASSVWTSEDERSSGR